MTIIYQASRSVVVWLCEGSEDVDLALLAIPDIEMVLSMMGGGPRLAFQGKFCPLGTLRIEIFHMASLFTRHGVACICCMYFSKYTDLSSILKAFGES